MEDNGIVLLFTTVALVAVIGCLLGASLLSVTRSQQKSLTLTAGGTLLLLVGCVLGIGVL